MTALLTIDRVFEVVDLVEALPGELDTLVGDRAYRLPDGEKQRAAIARLLLTAPGVIVLDEATAHHDSESEAPVKSAPGVAPQGRTLSLIAERLSTVRNAHDILVLGQGRILERGRHAELLAAGGPYTDLYLTQFADRPTAAQNEKTSTVPRAVTIPARVQPRSGAPICDQHGSRARRLCDLQP
jgi:ABC-type transport system involved in Fe-S cluster assembly fused permease/ATPase subunit